MTVIRTVLTLYLIGLCGLTSASAQECANHKNKLGVSRIVEIDTAGGGFYGTFQYPDSGLLQDGEVILTFDDGPHPKYTKQILRALEKQCTKATFFTVGQMARTYPETLKSVVNAGHTVGTHTWRHVNMQAIAHEKGVKDIERGFVAAELATGGHVAPFFRFPRLRHTEKMRNYLAANNIATFSVDIISGDTEIKNARRLLRRTLGTLRKKKKGIVLFHDLKKVTAGIIPEFLRELKKRGFKIVHIVPKNNMNANDLIAANGSAPNEGENLDLDIALATSSQLDSYFGPNWPKRLTKTKKDKKPKKPVTTQFKPALFWEPYPDDSW